ncbi:hypothetical protein CSUI_011431 [Cystoisospora suis]|uniref:Uncharacterized protein n=1 Tax=Cystoisospora suis TaxID=483139 RepID=A0A2C6KB91_9APIC|nr:hypothetical protein CSUI_011431 [Cystoisospora suis]
MDPMSLTDVSLHTAAGPERKCSQAKAANSTSSCSHSVKNSSASSRCRNQAVKWSVARPNMVGVVGFACAAVFCGVALSGEIKGAAALYVRPGAQAPQLTGHAGSFGSTEYPLSQRVDVEGDGIHPREPSSPEPRSQFYIHPVKRQATGVEPADAEGSFSQLREQGFDLDLDLDLDFDLDDLPQTTAGGADSAMGEEPTDKAKKEKSPNADLDFGSSETSGSTGSLGGDFDFGSSEKNDSTTKSSNYETERDLFGQGTAAPVTGVLSPLSGKCYATFSYTDP